MILYSVTFLLLIKFVYNRIYFYEVYYLHSLLVLLITYLYKKGKIYVWNETNKAVPFHLQDIMRLFLQFHLTVS
jgi:hypothetical protein